MSVPPILSESWSAYAGRFIQKDGRVIDHKGGGISTSEGQAYAMLRAVWMHDRPTFDRAYKWGVDNLNSKIRSDRLWAWKWGKDKDGTWHVLDRAFASDADQDVALALILAWKTFNEPAYWADAQQLLADLWNKGTILAGQRRVMLAGDTLCKGSSCRLNPSYAAPYAYRIFAKFDTARDWNALVDASYNLLETSSALTKTHLPPDWVVLNTNDGRITLADNKDSAFSYDAFRVYWRVALDRQLFNDPRADRYLAQTLGWLTREWNARRKLPAVISASGQPLADYESIEMLAALAPALRHIDRDIGDAVYRKVNASYSDGIWAERDSYYIQNWAWFGAALYNGYTAPFDRIRY
jgi:endo-1,4-beta-D-glucanase Y